MGLYIRKSISVGPLRFNLSKSGIGVSAGVRGLRFGSGPRGNYIHMGRGGLYYRKTLSSPEHSNAGLTPNDTPNGVSDTSWTHEELRNIQSSEVTQLADQSSAELLLELNEKKKIHQLWPFMAFLTCVLLFIMPWLTILSFLLIVACLSVTYILYKRDVFKKTTVLLYDLEPEYEKDYENLHSALSMMASCDRAWIVDSMGKVHDRKYNAGASRIITRKTVRISIKEAPFLKTNISTYSINTGYKTFYFFPDRLLVYGSDGIGAINYNDLRIETNDTRFIEDGYLPRDSKVVDRTWRYVNRNGGPDRRFNNNTEIPICLYETMRLFSFSGLNDEMQLSRCGLGSILNEAIRSIAQTTSKSE